MSKPDQATIFARMEALRKARYFNWFERPCTHDNYHRYPCPCRERVLRVEKWLARELRRYHNMLGW